jgi:uncharacterized protein (TIGR03435 family)
MRSFATALLLLAGSAAYAADGPTFEVASIKATAPQEMGRIMVRMGGSPGRIDWVNVSLRDMVRYAYDVKDYQVTGPDWLGSARFDVDAKYPPDTKREDIGRMMQNLLAERFGVKIHKESKEVPVFNLVVGKSGPKLKKADENSTIVMDGPDGPRFSTRDTKAEGGPAPSGGGGGAVGTALGAARAGGPGGPGGPGGGRPGMVMMRMEGAGRMVMTAKGQTMQQFTDMLARQVGKPVINQTGIEGLYDIDLEFKPEANMGGMGGGMRVMAGPPPGGGDGGPAPDGVEAPSIFTAVQDQLGLKLESNKGPVETIVVDSANKTPTEN